MMACESAQIMQVTLQRIYKGFPKKKCWENQKLLDQKEVYKQGANKW